MKTHNKNKKTREVPGTMARLQQMRLDAVLEKDKVKFDRIANAINKLNQS